MAVAGVIAAFAAGRITPLVGDCVEPFRDQLVRRVVAGELHRATSSTSVPVDASAVARIVGQTDGARDISAVLLAQAFTFGATVVMTIVGLVLLEPLAAAVVLAPVVVTLLVVAAMVPVLARRTRRVLRTEEAVAAITAAVAVARRDIAACAAEDHAAADVERAIARRARAGRSLARASAARGAVSGLGGSATLVVLLVAAPWLVAGGRLSVGGLLGAIVYVTANLQPALGNAAETMAGSVVHLRVVLRNLARSTSTSSPSTGADHRAVVLPAAPVLRAEGLTFAHGVGARRIVDGLDLAIDAGRHIAVVGPSGVGKSTLVDLLAGLCEPDAGRLSIGGVPFDRLPPAGLRSLITIVPQEAYVFAGTMRSNLAYLRPAASDDELHEAAAETGLDVLVDRLGGLDEQVEPGELSEGERQLVVATRAWLSSAAIVILDEGTSRLDPAAEARVEAALRRRPGALVVVAHRISSARRADEILLMDGDRVHRGTHDDLLVTSPLYAELVGHWTHPATTRIQSRVGASV